MSEYGDQENQFMRLYWPMFCFHNPKNLLHLFQAYFEASDFSEEQIAGKNLRLASRYTSCSFANVV